jgi:hypothetical protein
MKTVLLNLFLLISLNSFGQLPEIKTNVEERIKLESVVYDILHIEYDFIISFTTESYWSSKENFQVIAKKGETWNKLNIKRKKKKNGNFSKPKIRKQKLKSETAENLLRELTNESFWTLNRDSLNNFKVEDKENGITHLYTKTDGTNYKFEVFTKSNFLLINAYEPEYYSKVIPEVISRRTFISCANLFINMVKE